MLSVAMIGCDESHCIAQALRSVVPYADEVVFMDTGSRDATPEIANSFGAKVFHAVWEDDFSIARNAALDRCTGDWVLSIDCDEAISPNPETKSFFKSLNAARDDIAFVVNIRNYLSDGKLEAHSNIRLFRKLKEIQFTNPIHESVSSSIYEFAPDKPLDIAKFDINHFGYQSIQRNKEKLLRNLRIMARWVETDANDPFAWYKFGLSLRSVSPDRGAACLFKAYELLVSRTDLKTHPYRFDLVRQLIDDLNVVNPRLSTIVRECSHELVAE